MNASQQVIHHNGFTVRYSGKVFQSLEAVRVNFTDGSYCIVSWGVCQVVSKGSGSLSASKTKQNEDITHCTCAGCSLTSNV